MSNYPHGVIVTEKLVPVTEPPEIAKIVTIHDLFNFLIKKCKISRCLIHEYLGRCMIFVPKKSLNRVRKLAFYSLPGHWLIEPLERSMKKNRIVVESKFNDYDPKITRELIF